MRDRDAWKQRAQAAEAERERLRDEVDRAYRVVAEWAAERDAAVERATRLRAALEELATLKDNYPPDVFIEPDWRRVHDVLGTHGLNLAGVSGSNWRKALENVAIIAKQALADTAAGGEGA
jgi:hypothetical protein